MSTDPSAASSTFYDQYGANYIAVNEDGNLRSKSPMWNEGLAYSQAYSRPIDAGVAKGHIVFFIHGGLNDLVGVQDRIERFAVRFTNERWHLIHLAWDTSIGAAIDDIIAKLDSWRSWRNILRFLQIALPWNWFGRRRELLRDPLRYFGSVVWKSEYTTALEATRSPAEGSVDRARGFYRSFAYLNEAVKDNAGVRISFVVHSAGSIVANYLLTRIHTDFPALRDRINTYVLLAPACHVTQFQDSLKPISLPKPGVVMALTSALEQADSIKIDKGSLLLHVYDRFEANWKPEDFTDLQIPMRSDLPSDNLWNRAILGVEDHVAGLEQHGAEALDRSFGQDVAWAHTGEEIEIRQPPPQTWTAAQTHGDFDDDPTTLESIKKLLA